MRTSTFYLLIPILLQCASLQLLWPLQIPKNFKFKPIFLVFLPTQDEFSSSSSSPHAAIHVMNYHPLSYLIQDVMKINPRMLLEKTKKNYDELEIFKFLEPLTCHGWNLWWMIRV